jgi:hypothetical protein
MKCHCPGCDARLKLGDDVAPGTQIQCPKCNKNFYLSARNVQPATMPSAARKKAPAEDVAERDEPESRPNRPWRRPRRKKKETNSTAILLAVVVGAVVVVSGAIGGVIWWRSKTKDNQVAQIPITPAPAPPSTPAPAGANTPNLPVGREIGNLAPEIEGEDIDGQRFKLSDYRGKVVVLDFWGHW